MAVGGTPRSVADATRFTANTPHANTKAGASNAASSSSPSPSSSKPSSMSSPSSVAARRPPQKGGMPPPGMPRPMQQETIEERVRRLRAAHLAAKKADISRFDRVVDYSRKYFDAAHKFTVMGLIGFSGLALLVTVYATADMMMYNRKRRNEFFALQKQLKEDSLEAARLAYMTGKASEDQIALVEDATAKAKQAGVSLPSLLSAPQTPAPAGGRELDTRVVPADAHAERTVWPGESMVGSSMSGANDDTTTQQKKTGWFKSMLFGGLKKDEEEPQAREQGQLNFNEEEKAASSGWAADGSQHALKEKAKAAFEQERDNQRRGGPLDNLGLEDKPKGDEKKKTSWW
ncbi:Uu.00g121240.m01.CDS01 [Anthostomella pinea]|uniref:Uu.00g121240.m01.CDS01 n=1 Tax=Anthostomella pinea TaxID=933095 RepID=A0AAI8VGZ2_9PEZI|nr:Uu.00g121240.m01.CDS01 [Anthostomella pinea]